MSLNKRRSRQFPFASDMLLIQFLYPLHFLSIKNLRSSGSDHKKLGTDMIHLRPLRKA